MFDNSDVFVNTALEALGSQHFNDARDDGVAVVWVCSSFGSIYMIPLVEEMMARGMALPHHVVLASPTQDTVRDVPLGVFWEGFKQHWADRDGDDMTEAAKEHSALAVSDARLCMDVYERPIVPLAVNMDVFGVLDDADVGPRDVLEWSQRAGAGGRATFEPTGTHDYIVANDLFPPEPVALRAKRVFDELVRDIAMRYGINGGEEPGQEKEKGGE